MIAVESITTKFGTSRLVNGYWVISKGTKSTHRKKLHRLFYEDYHKCTLLSNSVIHHKDGNKLNNRIDNLELMGISEHIKLHKTGKKRKPFTEEHKRKLSEAKIGNKYAVGLKHSDETIRKIKEANIKHWIPCGEELLKENKEHNVSYVKLAEKYSCSKSTIYRKIREAKRGD